MWRASSAAGRQRRAHRANPRPARARRAAHAARARALVREGELTSSEARVRGRRGAPAERWAPGSPNARSRAEHLC